MTPIPPFPKSFPTAQETLFLKLILGDEASFKARFHEWKASVAFDDIDYATLRLLPLLAIRLRALGVSDPDTTRIQGVYKLAWVSNQRLLHEVSGVVQNLESNGVPVMVLKGVPLLFSAYKDVGARFLGDGDILIDPSKAVEAMKCMHAQGWRLKNPPHPEIRSFSARRLAETVKELTFVNATEVEIDMHLHVFQAPCDTGGIDRMPFKELLANALKTSFRGHSYLSMSAEDLFIHIVAHGAEGNVHRALRWVPDAVHVMRAFPLNWDMLMAKALRRGLALEVATACTYLLQNEFITLPETTMHTISSIRPSKKELRAYHRNGRRTTPYPLFGNVARLWRDYWRYETSGFSIPHLYGFLTSAARAWGVRHPKDLPSFIVQKYKNRIARLFYRS